MKIENFHEGGEYQLIGEISFLGRFLGEGITLNRGLRVIGDMKNDTPPLLHFHEKQSGIMFSVIPDSEILDKFHPIC